MTPDEKESEWGKKSVEKCKGQGTVKGSETETLQVKKRCKSLKVIYKKKRKKLQIERSVEALEFARWGGLRGGNFW